MAALLTACSTDDAPTVIIDPVEPEVEEGSNFLSIGLATPGGVLGRAVNPDDYIEGEGAEFKVNDVRFYFFGENLQAAPVKKNPDKSLAAGKDVYDNYYDYTPVGNEFGGGNEDATIEQTLTVTLTLTTKENKPAYVVAIINPSAATKKDVADLDELTSIVDNFVPGENDGFVMSNSVYLDGNGKEVNATKIKKLCNSAEEALDPDNRTVIYVERVAARLDLAIGKSTESRAGDDDVKLVPAAPENGYEGSDTKNVFFTGTKYKMYDATDEDEEEPVFVKFLAWQITSTPKKSNLVKDIDTWDNALFGSDNGAVKEPWNAETYFRSFWAMNPVLNGAEDKTKTGNTDYQFYSYNEISLPFGEGNKAVKQYLHENAAKNGSDDVYKNHETKVIVKAQLLDKTGEPLPVVEYGYKFYTKETLLQYFADQLEVYSSADKADGTKITDADLDFTSHAKFAGDAGTAVAGGYFSYVTLSTQGKGKTWYANGEALTNVDSYINNHLDSRLLVWEGGRTYYYFTVRHLGAGDEDNPGKGFYGVVRNHIYKSYITNVTGLGTPVLDPNETIYPEKPSRDGSVLSVDIKVLSWRVLSQDYEFSW